MPTLYVENVPKDLYEALRTRARKQRRSIAAEVISLLEENVPTEKELKRRAAVVKKLRSLRFTNSSSDRAVPSSLDLIHENRER
jgi:plasmid stability protein